MTAPEAGGGGEAVPAPPAGRRIAFTVHGEACAITVPPPGDLAIPSLFLVSLPKAGSTLLNRLMRPIAAAAGLAFVGLQEALHQSGVGPKDTPAAVNDAFAPFGYAFGGFRSLPGAFELPPYASGRTALLVRDPRDMLTSLYFSLAYSHRPPGTGAGGLLAAAFAEQRREVSASDIDSFVLDNVETVLGQFRRVRRKLARLAHRTWRYEDGVFDKLGWARSLVDYFGLPVEEGVVAAAAAENDVRPAVEDVTEHIRQVSPGDHRNKLAPATIGRLNAELAPVLEAFDYA